MYNGIAIIGQYNLSMSILVTAHLSHQFLLHIAYIINIFLIMKVS